MTSILAAAAFTLLAVVCVAITAANLLGDGWWER